MKKGRNLKLSLNRETVLKLATSEDLAQVGGNQGSPFPIVRTAATCDFGYCTQLPASLNCA